MDTTARRALSDLIDQLCTPAPAEPVLEVPATVAGLVEPPTAAHLVEPRVEPVPGAVTADESARPVEPCVQPAPALVPPQPAPSVVPAAVTVLPGGSRSAILWRSR